MTTTAERPRVAVVTGTSRDVGEFSCYGLAQAGWGIVGLYKNPEHDGDQAEIIRKVRGHRVKMVAGRGDLTEEGTPDLLVAQLVEHFDGKAGGLLLGAAGGYNKPIEEASAINVDANLRLIDALRDYLTPGSNIVFDTSDAAHRFRVLKAAGVELEEYGSVAQSKNEFETIFRSKEPEFMERGIGLVVIVGNALEGTFVTRVLKGRRQTRDMVGNWLDLTEEGHFPIGMEMAVANVRALRGNYPSAHTEYVGIKPEYQLYPSRPDGLRLVGAPEMMEGSVLSRDEIYDIIPHRWPFMFLGGIEDIKYGEKATGWLVDLTHSDINWRKGHFPDHPIVPGVITQEALLQLGALTALGAPEHRGKIAAVTKVEELRYRQLITPGEKVRLEAEMTRSREQRGVTFGRAMIRAINSQDKLALEGNVSFSLLPPSLTA